MATVPHTGTRWINSCFKSSKIPFEWVHFGPNGPSPKEFDFTLIRNPLDVLRTFLKHNPNGRDVEIILEKSWRSQARFISQGGAVFSIHDSPIERIGKHFGIELVDSGERFSCGIDIDLPQEWVDWYAKVFANGYSDS